MHTVNDKAIVLRTKRPHLVTEKIEKSAIIGKRNDVYEVAVNWGLDETQLLAELQIKDLPYKKRLPVDREAYSFPTPT